MVKLNSETLEPDNNGLDYDVQTIGESIITSIVSVADNTPQPSQPIDPNILALMSAVGTLYAGLLAKGSI